MNFSVFLWGLVQQPRFVISRAKLISWRAPAKVDRGAADLYFAKKKRGCRRGLTVSRAAGMPRTGRPRSGRHGKESKERAGSAAHSDPLWSIGRAGHGAVPLQTTAVMERTARGSAGSDVLPFLCRNHRAWRHVILPPVRAKLPGHSRRGAGSTPSRALPQAGCFIKAVPLLGKAETPRMKAASLA